MDLVIFSNPLFLGWKYQDRLGDTSRNSMNVRRIQVIIWRKPPSLHLNLSGSLEPDLVQLWLSSFPPCKVNITSFLSSHVGQRIGKAARCSCCVCMDISCTNFTSTVWLVPSALIAFSWICIFIIMSQSSPLLALISDKNKVSSTCISDCEASSRTLDLAQLQQPESTPVYIQHAGELIGGLLQQYL